MKKLISILGIALLIPILSVADEEIAPRPLSFSGGNFSDAVFTILPPKYDDSRKVVKEPFGVAYRLDSDGNLNELYRTKGWYAFQVYLSPSGRYLVRMGPWNRGRRPDKDDLALAIYDNGILLKSYSTADLVKDHDKVEASVSHYSWQASSLIDNGQYSAGERFKMIPNLGYNSLFEIHTIDGWTYTFDVTNGQIKSETRTKEWLKEAK